MLIPANVDYVAQSAFRYLRTYFSDVAPHSVRMLANCPLVSFNAGSHGEEGRASAGGLPGPPGSGGGHRRPARHPPHSLGRGAGRGAVGADGEPACWTVRASSYITAIQIPEQLYLEFIRENSLEESTRRQLENRLFLQGTWLFGELLGFPGTRFSALMVPQKAAAGVRILRGPSHGLFLLEKGDIELRRDGRLCETLGAGGFWEKRTCSTGRGSSRPAR